MVTSVSVVVSTHASQINLHIKLTSCVITCLWWTFIWDGHFVCPHYETGSVILSAIFCAWPLLNVLLYMQKEASVDTFTWQGIRKYLLLAISIIRMSSVAHFVTSIWGANLKLLCRISYFAYIPRDGHSSCCTHRQQVQYVFQVHRF